MRERVVLFCVESGTDWRQVSGGGETVTVMIENGLITRAAGGAHHPQRSRARRAAGDAAGAMSLIAGMKCRVARLRRGPIAGRGCPGYQTSQKIAHFLPDFQWGRHLEAIPG